MKRKMIGHAMCFQNNHTRVVLEASWTTPCTGIAAAGDISCSMIAINAVPPPAPTTAVKAEVQNAAPESSAISMGDINLDPILWK